MKVKTRFCGVFAFAAIIGLFWAGCDLFSPPADFNLLQKIDEEVRVSNAPVINVRVMGVESGVTQNVPMSIKLGVAFDLKFTPFPNYGFIRWAAVYNGTELGQIQVTFSNRTSMDTTVTVNVNPGAETLWIVPMGEGANSTDGFEVYPIGDGVHYGVDTNPTPSNPFGIIPQEHYISIRFSKPLASDTFRIGSRDFDGSYIDSWLPFGSGGGNPYYDLFGAGIPNSFSPQGIFSVRFNNLAITGAVNPPGGFRGFYLENFYYPPVLSADGKTVYIWSRTLRGGTNDKKPSFQAMGTVPATLWNSYPAIVSVNISGSIKDSSGLHMGLSKSFSFQMIHNSSPTAYMLDVSYTPGSLGIPGKDIFPRGLGNVSVIFEENALAASINPDDIIEATPAAPLIIPADDKPRWAYLIFQASNSRWRVVGGRIAEKPDFVGSTEYEATDVPLLGEDIPGEGQAVSAVDIQLREKLIAAYAVKMRGNMNYFGDYPVYVVRYQFRGHTTSGTKNVGVLARVTVEPTFPSGLTEISGSSGNIHYDLNRNGVGQLNVHYEP